MKAKYSKFTVVVTTIILVFAVCFSVYNFKSSYAMTAGGETPIMKSFSLKNNDLTIDDKLDVNVDLEYYRDNGVNYYAIWLKNESTGSIVYMTSDGSTPIFDLKNAYYDSFIPGEYEIESFVIFPIDSNDTISMYENTKNYNAENNSGSEWYIRPYDFPKVKISDSKHDVTYVEDNTVNSEYTLNIYDNMVKQGENLNIDVYKMECDQTGVTCNKKDNNLSKMLLSFVNETDGSVLNAYVKSLKNGPYIVIPNKTTAGVYKFNSATLTSKEGKTYYYTSSTATNDKMFGYNISFTVTGKEENNKYKYSFNNSDYDRQILNDVKELDDNAIITVDANERPVIRESLFKEIMGTKRTLRIEFGDTEWVFNGRNITNIKSVDVSTIVDQLNSRDNFNDYLKSIGITDAAKLKFVDNGKLPGKALIRINSELLKEIIYTNELYVYYYDENGKKLLTVAMEVQQNDDYYEFYIDHNSNYLLTSKKVKKVSDNDSAYKLNNKNEKDVAIPSNNSNIVLYCCCGVIAALIIIIVIMVVKNKKLKQRSKKKETI